MTQVQLILVDTCVLLDDPEVLVRIQQAGGLPVLTGTVLDELDYNKKGDEKIHQNARMIFREFNKTNSIKLLQMPTGDPIQQKDVLSQFFFKSGPVILIARDVFRTGLNNDSKIIELAKDYQMILITRDVGMKVRAEALGVNVSFWTGPEGINNYQRKNGTHQGFLNNAPSAKEKRNFHEPEPFALYSTPINEEDTTIAISKIPATGDIVKLGSGFDFRLGAAISAGGEGSIYECELAGQVCKIYHQHKLTQLKKKKIELMVGRKINRIGICWPVETVTTTKGEFVGYLMPRATGHTMQSAMFVKPRLEKIFPHWNRLDLVNVAGNLVNHILYLHSLNIIIGDINPMNILVTNDSTKIWIVDTDSFQIENFPCPVGTVNFTPPEIQGKNYSDFLRTKEHELFAVATMIFMILHPGKPPYSQQGGESPAENIRAKNFPYRYLTESSSDNVEFSGKNAPQGTWQFIWGNLPKVIKEAFHKTFREDKRTSVNDWANLLRNYRHQLVQGYTSNDLFSLSFKVHDPINIACAKCSKTVTQSNKWVEKLTAQGKPVWCPECANRDRVERLATQSKRATERVAVHPTGHTHHTFAKSTGASHKAGVNATNTTSTSIPKQRPKLSAPLPPPTFDSGSFIKNIFQFLFK